MPTRIRAADEAGRRMTHQLQRVLTDVRDARLAAGLPQVAVARAAGMSGSSFSRLERGRGAIDVFDLARIAAAVGVDIALRGYAARPALRDRAQVRLLQRFFARLGPRWTRQLEVPVGSNQQVFDAVVRRDGHAAAVEAITRLRDVQAQLRPILRKQAESGAPVLILVLAETPANRRALDLMGEILLGDFPCRPRETLQHLDRGELPPGNGIVRL